MRQAKRAVITTCFALLQGCRYQPLAFTGNPSNHGGLSSRVRRRVVARSLLHALPPAVENDERLAAGAEFSSPRLASTTKERTKVRGDQLSSTSTTLTALVDSQKEFEMSLGRAVDTLKADYPKLLTKDPSWHIYHQDIEVIDPTGVSLHGLPYYKRAFSFIHTLVQWFYCEEKSGLTSIRCAYDWARKVIRVSWNVELTPKKIYGGEWRMLHIDGISEYSLDRESGLITEHKVTNLLINDQAVRPVNGIFSALETMSPDPEGVPVFSKGLAHEISNVKFQTWNPLGRSTSLFSNNGSSGGMDAYAEQMKELTSDPLAYDADAFQKKNASRKKFGVPPLTVEEFIKIEEQVREMDRVTKKKAALLAEEMMEQRRAAEEKKNGGFLSKIFGGALKNGCESNFDCERPEVCCDVGFKKICCTNGLGIVDGIPVEKYQRGVLRVPLPNDNVDY
mmetsp:Transcript_34007/g.81408  ORF Transcript_34007/g.81408 Transcript_34007/m.81408 type:complete len:450 (+) Transcript_34007:169-1518(+)